MSSPPLSLSSVAEEDKEEKEELYNTADLIRGLTFPTSLTPPRTHPTGREVATASRILILVG